MHKGKAEQITLVYGLPKETGTAALQKHESNCPLTWWWHFYNISLESYQEIQKCYMYL